MDEKQISDFRRKTITSYYDYPLRSFLCHRRAYLMLALSVFCMIVLCTSVLVYYASRYEADLEETRRETGPQHTVFYDVAPEDVSLYTDHSYVKDAMCVNLYASADNSDTYATLSQVYFTEDTEACEDYFYIDVTEGRQPETFGEIMVSDKAARYFSCFSLGEELPVDIYVRGVYRTVSFTVVGVFSSCSSAEQYVFCNTETVEYLRGDDLYSQDYTTDVYLRFTGSQPTAYKRGMQRLINDLGLVEQDEEGNTSEIYYDDRNSMLSEVALASPFYESTTMQLMFLFSILPAALALIVFVYLDMQKNLGELASLSMIGATWKQLFRMQWLKYGAIFAAVFPFGAAGAALLMYFVCDLTNRISPDKVFLWYRFDFPSVLFLFVLSFGILTATVFFLTKRMTSVTYSEMLSAAHQSGNIFVSKTSNLLFGGDHLTERISLLFFTRNRRVNKLFCAVVILLTCIYAFFTMQVAREYGAAPDSTLINTVDYYLYGDTDASYVYDTMSPDLQEQVEKIQHVSSVQRELRVSDFYADAYGIKVTANIKKQIVSNSVINGAMGLGAQGKVIKRGLTNVRLIGYDSDLLNLAYLDDLVAGDFASLYEEENTIALVVNAYSESKDKYYHVGDTLSMQISYTVSTETADGYEEQQQSTAMVDYKIGAIIYRPDDDPNEKIVTVCCSADLFEEITGIADIYTYSVQCDSDDQEVLSVVAEKLSALEDEYKFTVTDMHEQLRQASEQAMHTVLYVYIMKLFVLIVAILLLVAMTRFMLEVRAPSMRALWLIGAQNRQIMHICLLEFLIASAGASILGILVSVIGTAFVSVRFDIAFYFTPLTVLLVVLAAFLLTAMNIFVPVGICYNRMRKES